MLFLSRIVQGAGGGTVGVVQAYVADATEPKDRARALGWLSAATNVGVTVGPLLGSGALVLGMKHLWVGTHDLSLGQAAPGILAAVILCREHVLRVAIPPRVTVVSRRVKVPGRYGAVLRSVILHSEAPASRLIWIYAIGLGAFMASMSIIALFLASKFEVTASSIGWFFGYVGFLNMFTRAFVLGPVIDRFGEPVLSRIGIMLLALGLVLIPVAPNIPVLAVVIDPPAARHCVHLSGRDCHAVTRDLVR